jgi:hypothetical protein
VSARAEKNRRKSTSPILSFKLEFMNAVPVAEKKDEHVCARSRKPCFGPRNALFLKEVFFYFVYFFNESSKRGT